MDFELLLIRINEVIHQSIDEYKQKIIRESGYADLSLSQLYYLEAIFHLGNPTLSELAGHLKISKASATTGVQKLMAKDLAEKIQSSQDQRVFHVSLTAKGNQLMEAEFQAVTDFSEKIRQTLSLEEKADLTRLFEKILAAYQT